MKIRRFDDWLDMMSKDMATDTEIDCPDCYGTGESECDHCGAYADCETCGSEGKVLAGDVSRKQIRDSLTRKQYTDALESDLTDLADWQGDDRIVTLTNHGLRVFSDIDTKRETVVYEGH